MATIGTPAFSNSVLLNCPFDRVYMPVRNAIVFCIKDCGFVVRCALEEEDGGEVRIEKIFNLISQCRYGIHDLSRIELDAISRLPRFNMPLELGIFFGAKRFGQRSQKRKKCLILEKEPGLYRSYISNIAGHDVRAHDGDPEQAVHEVRAWLRTASQRKSVPGFSFIWDHYLHFVEDLPAMCQELQYDSDDLVFNDFIVLVETWLEQV